MKGLVFDEFNEMVINTFGEDMLDDIIDECEDELSSGGAYTAVGVYDAAELVTLVSALHKRTDIPVDQLVFAFGKYLAGVFATKFPSFFEACDDTFSFLKCIDNHIHVEVYKLYPDSELPEFSYKEISDTCLELTYSSTRHFSDLAHGLMVGVSEYFKETLIISKLDKSTEALATVVFTIEKG